MLDLAKEPTIAVNRTLVKRVALGVLAVLAGAALVVLYLYPPTEYKIYPGCTFYQATGLYCPGCGATRSLHSLLHADLAQAFAYNPLFILTMPFMLLVFLRTIFASRLPGSLREKRQPVWCIYTIGVIFLTFWITRNIDVYPFNLLAPHGLEP